MTAPRDSFLKITATPVFTMTRSEVVSALGGDETLFQKLCKDYGLRPVDRRPTRKTYRVAAVEDALREKELAEDLEN